MYSTYVKQLSFAVEEMAESITSEESEYLEEKYDKVPLQKILTESSVDEVLDYISHTKKQRETLKKYDPYTKRAELKLRSYLYLQASLDLYQELSSAELVTVQPKAMTRWAIQMYDSVTHPNLSAPWNYHKELFKEVLDSLEMLGISLRPPKNK